MGFSCKLVLIKRTLFSLRGRKYIFNSDAPEIIATDVTQEVYYQISNRGWDQTTSGKKDYVIVDLFFLSPVYIRE